MDEAKTWVRGHPYQALALGYVIFFVCAAAVRLALGANGLADALLSAFIYTSVYGLFALFQLRRARKTTRRLDDNGQVKAFIRYPDSRPGSLSSIWNQGIATPGAASIRFQPAVDDSLEPSGRAVEITVREVLPERRKIGGKDRKYRPASYQAVIVLTDAGRIELAASPESLDRLTRVLLPGPG